jgi:hypothetical protein
MKQKNYLGIMSVAIAIIVLVFGNNFYQQFTGHSIFVIFKPPKPLDCSLTTEIGPWSASDTVTLNANRDGWVQADFWSPSGAIVPNYDEVSIILEPHIRIRVSGAVGIAWKYDRSWSKEDVETCTQKHIQDSWDLRQKRLILIEPSELCSILGCQ